MVTFITKPKKAQKTTSIDIGTQDLMLNPAIPSTTPKASTRPIDRIADLQPLGLLRIKNNELVKFLVHIETPESLKPLGAYFDYTESALKKRLAPSVHLGKNERLLVQATA